MSGNIPTTTHKKNKNYGHHKFTIFIGGEEKYCGTSSTSTKAAICNSMAAFLALEEHDYHAYKGMAQADHFKDESWLDSNSDGIVKYPED